MANQFFRAQAILGLSVLALGCEQQDAHIPSEGPPPISGGTLEVTGDGRYAIASDPARAAIHIVDLQAEREIHRLDVDEHDEPGRIVGHSNGRIYVVMRRAGEVATIDPALGQIVERRAVCAAPRGIAEVPDTQQLVVACAGGELVYLPPNGVATPRSVMLEPDLRDVVAHPGGVLYVSRFRAAEVLVVRDDVITRRIRPRDSNLFGGLDVMTPTVAWRLRQGSSERELILLHQQSRSTQLGTLGGSSGVYYGGDCEIGVLRTVATVIDTSSETTRGVALNSTALGVDAVQFDSSMVALAAAAEPGPPNSFFDGNGFRQISMASATVDPACAGDSFPTYESDDDMGDDARGPAVAVAVNGGQLLTQYRDPARIVIREGGAMREIALSGGSVENLGHALFHEAAGTGVTCAGCHPEGGEDGHTWLFESGTRRSQTLRGGILETAPFHWAGEVAGVTNVFEGTFVGRMGGEMPRPDEIETFGQWVDALPQVPGVNDDPVSVDHGRTLFADTGCVSCHSGAMLTDNQVHDVGTGGAFQVPSLTGVLHHAPYFHDGAALSLDEVVEGHGGAEALTTEDRGDLVRYLRSL